MPAVSVADLAALAETLTKAIAEAEKTSRNLAGLIAAKGKEISNAQGLTYAKAAKEQIEEIKKSSAIEIQGRDDVIAELRRQLEVQVRLAGEGQKAKARLTAVRLVKVWRDDLGRGYVFTDELAHAVDPDTYPAPEPVRIDKEN